MVNKPLMFESFEFYCVITPRPLYNTVVGVHSINRVSLTTVLYPNKNVKIILKNDHLWSFFNIIYTFLGSIFEPSYIQNRVIRNHVIKRLKCNIIFPRHLQLWPVIFTA